MKPTWRVLLRIAALQCVVAVLGGLTALAFTRMEAASAFLFGVVLVLIATLVAAVLGLRRAGSPLDSMAKVIGASFSKWLMILVALYLALSRWQMAALPLTMGIVAAQISAIVIGLRQPKY